VPHNSINMGALETMERAGMGFAQGSYRTLDGCARAFLGLVHLLLNSDKKDKAGSQSPLAESTLQSRKYRVHAWLIERCVTKPEHG
jgi:hypothetical protein